MQRGPVGPECRFGAIYDGRRPVPEGHKAERHKQNENQYEQTQYLAGDHEGNYLLGGRRCQHSAIDWFRFSLSTTMKSNTLMHLGRPRQKPERIFSDRDYDSNWFGAASS
jgi:hypothetical protein